MAQSGFVPSLTSKIEGDGTVYRMLERSAGLDTLIRNSLHVADDGRSFIAPNEVRIANVARKVAFGLYCHQYTPKQPAQLEEFLALKPVHEHDSNNFIMLMAHNERFQPRRWEHVQTIKSPGHGKVQVFDRRVSIVLRHRHEKV